MPKRKMMRKRTVGKNEFRVGDVKTVITRESMFFKFGNNIYIGTSNNWKRNHGFPMTETKRYPHMRKDMPKHVRIRYYAMKCAGCDMNFIKKSLKLVNGFEWGERKEE